MVEFFWQPTPRSERVELARQRREQQETAAAEASSAVRKRPVRKQSSANHRWIRATDEVSFSAEDRDRSWIKFVHFFVIIYQQRFWVLSVIATIVAVVCWMLSASELEQEYTTNRSAIDTQFTNINSFNNQPFYPNPQVNKEDLQQTVKLSEMVENLWRELYARQREKVLFWPKVLGKEFINKVEQLKFGDPIGVVMRDRYLNYIKERFDGLLEIVKAKKLQGPGGRAGGYGGGYGVGEEAYGVGMAEGGRGGRLAGSAAVEDNTIVQWLDQAKLQQKLFWKKTPSALKIWVTQENLWVYETLLNVIAQTNEERAQRDRTTRRFGSSWRWKLAAKPASKNRQPEFFPHATPAREAKVTWAAKAVWRVATAGKAVWRVATAGKAVWRVATVGEGGMEGGYGREGDDGDAMLLAGRYLDAEGNPIDGDVETLAGEPYRRLPVRMVLLMDQRWISQLLVFCANQALPVEVQGLRVNPDKAAAGFGGEGRMGGSMRIQGVNVQAAEGMATVYLRGVVYIYNPPNQEQLTVPGAEQDQQDQFAESRP